MGSFWGLNAEHQRKLDDFEAEIELDNIVYQASMQFEAMELFDEAESRGEVYAETYKKGFWDAVHLNHKYNTEVAEERGLIYSEKIAKLKREAEK